MQLWQRNCKQEEIRQLDDVLVQFEVHMLALAQMTCISKAGKLKLKLMALNKKILHEKLLSFKIGLSLPGELGGSKSEGKLRLSRRFRSSSHNAHRPGFRPRFSTQIKD